MMNLLGGLAEKIPESTVTDQSHAGNGFFGFTPNQVVTHFSHGEITAATEQLLTTSSTAQVYQLGGKHCYPIAVVTGTAAGDATNVWKNVALIICTLKIDSDGAHLGKTHRVLGTDIHSDLTNKNVNGTGNDSDKWDTFATGRSPTVTIYPIKYNDSSYTSNKFGVVMSSKNGSYRYLYHEVFSVDMSSFEITKDASYSQRVNTSTMFNANTPFTSSSSSRNYNDVNLWDNLVIGQGFHLIPKVGSDYVAMNFGGYYNWYNDGTATWNMRAGLFETTNGYADLRSYVTQVADVDSTCGGGGWNSNEFFGHYQNGNRNAIRYGYANFGNTTGSITTKSFGPTTHRSYSSVGQHPYIYTWDPITQDSFLGFKDGTNIVETSYIANGSYGSASFVQQTGLTAAGSSGYTDTERNAMTVVGQKCLFQENNKLRKRNDGDTSFDSTTSTFDIEGADDVQLAIGTDAQGDATRYFKTWGYSKGLQNQNQQSSFALGMGYATSTSADAKKYPRINGMID